VKTAWDYMEYFRNGNRYHYQQKLWDHRARISQLVVGNLLDQEMNKSSQKYVDEIINGVWVMLEESTWCYPAHLGLQGTSDHLPNPAAHLAVDLNAGEYAKFLGWVHLLVGDRFDHVTPMVNKRIEFELKRRIFDAYLQLNFWWVGFTAIDEVGKSLGAHAVNNWNIWVNGNILKSALLTLTDAQLFNQVLNRTIHSTDMFLDGYGEDGGCDEGPAYWRQAGGRLIEYLESLVQIFGEPAREYFAKQKLLKSIGEYSYKMRIDSNWYVTPLTLSEN